MTSSMFHDQFGAEVFNWRNRFANRSLNNDSERSGKDYQGALCGRSERQNVILVCRDSSFSQNILLSYIWASLRQDNT